MEMPRELVPFLLDFNRFIPIIKFNERYFLTYVSKYLELILVPFDEEVDLDSLVFDISI